MINIESSVVEKREENWSLHSISFNDLEEIKSSARGIENENKELKNRVYELSQRVEEMNFQ